MIQFLQTDQRLNPKIQKYGCTMLSSLWFKDEDLSPHAVNTIYDVLLAHGMINENCKILSWALFLPKIDPTFTFVRKAGYDYVTEDDEREILKYHLSNINEDHFVAGNGKSMILFDPMNRLDIIQKYGSFVEKVIIKVS
jgi:hypothetical protein